MKSILDIYFASLPFLYLLTSILCTPCFLIASYKNQWSKGELLLGIGSFITLIYRLIVYFNPQNHSESKQGLLGLFLENHLDEAEHLSIVLYTVGAVLIALRHSAFSKAKPL